MQFGKKYCQPAPVRSPVRHQLVALVALLVAVNLLPQIVGGQRLPAELYKRLLKQHDDQRGGQLDQFAAPAADENSGKFAYWLAQNEADNSDGENANDSDSDSDGYIYSEEGNSNSNNDNININRIINTDNKDNNLISLAIAESVARRGANEPTDGDEIYILEDKDYPRSPLEHYPNVGQVSGIATLPTGDVAIFHRAEREWTSDTFNETDNTLLGARQDNLIKNDTILIVGRDSGAALSSLGANLFHMPHSIASDERGNLWVTDVGRHQVMRLPTGERLRGQTADWLANNGSRLWPDIILGEAFVPGADQAHFCKPSEVKVSSNGRLVYVADGYCNGRVVVFTGSGKFLTSFGESLGMSVVHSLTLFEERNLICVAARENARILCFSAGLNGDLNSIGRLQVDIKYPLGRVFAIEALSANHLLVSSNQPATSRFDLAALNPFTSELKQTWASSDLLAPHSLARTKDGLYVYAADISKDAYKKVFKFSLIHRRESL